MAKKTPVTRRPRAQATVGTSKDDASITLTSVERTLLNEALRRSEDVREQLEATVTSYGRWLLGAIFKDDASAALNEKSKNRVWLDLVRRAGGPTLRIGRRMLYVALDLAAHDKRITDQAWQNLDAGRKELLLPLGDDGRLREAAHHVSKWNLTQKKTRQYVAEALKGTGRSREVRLTVPRLVSRVRTLRTGLHGPGVLRKVIELRSTLEPAERARVAEELEELQKLLGLLAKTIRKKR
jgi:hypothetical protein